MGLEKVDNNTNGNNVPNNENNNINNNIGAIENINNSTEVLGEVDNLNNVQSAPLNPELPVDQQNLNTVNPGVVTEPVLNNNEVITEPVLNTTVQPEMVNNVVDNQDNYSAVQNNIPGVDQANAFATSIDMSNFTNPPVMDSNFGTVNTNLTQEVVGQMPPENKEKKPFNKVLFVILMLVLIGGVAYGIYYYLNLPKETTPTITVVPKEINITLGEELSNDINSYATFTNVDSSTCTLNLNDVDNTKAGTYEYNIICGTNTYKNNIIISDTTPIEVATKNVYSTINGTVNINDFIASNSKETCTYEYTSDTNITEYITTEGTYTVKILVKCDESETTVESSLFVISSEIEAFFYATDTEKTINGYEGTVIMTDSLAIDSSLKYIGISERTYVYTFTNETEYETVKMETTGKNTFDGIVGTITLNEDDMTLTIVSPLEKTTLDLEYGGTFPTDYASIKNYYISNGYSTESR